MAYGELHCHTNFSLLDGASAADELVDRAVELGLSGLAVTDHQGLYGAVRRHALLLIDGTLQREGNVVNVVARDARPLPEVAGGRVSGPARGCRRGGASVPPAGPVPWT